MYPMSSLEHFQPHIGEESLGNGNIMFIQVFRMFTLHEHRGTIPRNARGRVGEIANMRYGVVQQLQRYPECEVTRG